MIEDLEFLKHVATRRELLRNGAAGVGSLALSSMLAPDAFAEQIKQNGLHFAPRAKRIIVLFLTAPLAGVIVTDCQRRPTGATSPHETAYGGPVFTFGMFAHAQVLRLRRVHRCLANRGSDSVAFFLSGRDRHTEVVISELNSWPALPFARALKTISLPKSPLR